MSRMQKHSLFLVPFGPDPKVFKSTGAFHLCPWALDQAFNYNYIAPLRCRTLSFPLQVSASNSRIQHKALVTPD